MCTNKIKKLMKIGFIMPAKFKISRYFLIKILISKSFGTTLKYNMFRHHSTSNLQYIKMKDGDNCPCQALLYTSMYRGERLLLSFVEELWDDLQMIYGCHLNYRLGITSFAIIISHYLFYTII